jgi:hypothetical protein
MLSPKGLPEGPRVAVVSTPRSGNTWLRRLLGTAYDVPQFAAHTPSGVDWDGLPGGCILQLHWLPTEILTARLTAHRFATVALARHPLDVLLSVLHFCQREAATGRWLDGRGGDETSLRGVTPRSLAFREYVRGPRAAALLAVSRAWWVRPEARRVRYEDLVRDPAGELQRLTDALSFPVRRPVAEAVAAQTLEEQRRHDAAHAHHYWQGQPGLWRHLLPPWEVGAVEPALAGTVADLGYACDPDPDLTDEQADAAWRAIE